MSRCHHVYCVVGIHIEFFIFFQLKKSRNNGNGQVLRVPFTSGPTVLLILFATPFPSALSLSKGTPLPLLPSGSSGSPKWRTYIVNLVPLHKSNCEAWADVSFNSPICCLQAKLYDSLVLLKQRGRPLRKPVSTLVPHGSEIWDFLTHLKHTVLNNGWGNDVDKLTLTWMIPTVAFSSPG